MHHLWDRGVEHQNFRTIVIDLRNVLDMIDERTKGTARMTARQNSSCRYLESISTSQLPALASVCLWHPGMAVVAGTPRFKFLEDATARLREQNVDF